MGTDEAIHGIIPNASKKKGWFKRETWNLVFTNRRMIAALLTDDLIKAEGARLAQAAQAQGAGALKRMWSTATAGMNFYQTYLSMPPDEILKQRAENYSLDLPQIQAVRASSGSMEENTNNPDTLTIRTASEKLEFALGSSSLPAGQVVQLLRPILGERVK